MTFFIAPIVEGQTEQKCIERLLHRIWNELLNRGAIRPQILAPFRTSRSKIMQEDENELKLIVLKAYEKIKMKTQGNPDAHFLVLILLDAEEDCPATHCPRLMDSAKRILPVNTPVSCVFAKRMLENWIFSGASTLGGVNDLPDSLPERDRYEDRNGAAWLEEQFRKKNPARKYKKTVDAEELVRKMNLQECRANSPSFEKLCRDLDGLCP